MNGESHLQASSKRVREVFARYELGNVLMWAFAPDGPHTLPEDQLEDFFYGLKDRVRAVDPAWAAAMEALRGVPVDGLRPELAAAFEQIRGIARSVATLQPTAMIPMAVQIYLPAAASDRDGQPRWMMRGRLADALLWTTFRLFAEVPRSLIRVCDVAGCPRVFVAIKHQRFCVEHQAAAHHQARRRQSMVDHRARKKQKARKTR